jgi:hypothetical protein
MQSLRRIITSKKDHVMLSGVYPAHSILLCSKVALQVESRQWVLSYHLSIISLGKLVVCKICSKIMIQQPRTIRSTCDQPIASPPLPAMLPTLVCQSLIGLGCADNDVS